jgi:site-specific DNA-cytosine methylase
MPKEAKQIITEALGVEPIMINAALVSAQNRKRLFWTNIPGVVLPDDKGILLKDILEDGSCDRLKSYCIDANYFKGGSLKNYLEKSRRQVVMKQSEQRLYEVQAIAQRGRNIVDGKRKDILGAKTEQRFEVGGDKANTITKVQKDSMVLLIPEATKKGYAEAHDGDSIDLSFMGSKTRRGRVGNKAKNIMTSQNIGVFTDSIIRKLTPIECERLQGLPDNYTDGVSNTQRYKACGNAFNVDVVTHILGFIK